MDQCEECPFKVPFPERGFKVPRIVIQNGLSANSRIVIDGVTLYGATGYTLKQDVGQLPVLEIRMIGDIIVDGQSLTIPLPPKMPKDDSAPEGYREYAAAVLEHLTAIKSLRDGFIAANRTLYPFRPRN